ncbi:hypothetical protein D039_4714B, partial [Vibrio parahaemolyticus EKP-028]
PLEKLFIELSEVE